MAVESTMLELGTKAPDFALPDTLSGRTVRKADYQGQPLLVMFLCTHCPYVKHLERELAALANAFAGKGVGVVAVGSNDAESYPDDAPEKLAEQGERLGFSFPYLYDETQAVAKAYAAACTPDFFLFDREHRLAYRGRFDASRPRQDVPVTGDDLRRALEAVLAGERVPEPHYPSMGCNVKWKVGNAPDYYGAA
jgi:peroxiredoxin